MSMSFTLIYNTPYLGGLQEDGLGDVSDITGYGSQSHRREHIGVVPLTRMEYLTV